MRRLLFLPLLLWLAPALAMTPFEVRDIRVEGLERISPGTLFTYLPVNVGDTLDERLAAEAIRALYRTDFFNDVRLQRDDGALVVVVEERPAIAEIEVTGNRAIRGEQLDEALRQLGLAEGRVFNRSMLERVELELQRQYFALGRYGAVVKTEVTPLERNRVAVAIDIIEGRPARIRQVNVVGNTTFSDAELLRRFDQRPRASWALWSRRDQYSRQQLAGDLENLRSYYMDQGFINFSIDSTQVSITPDKQEIYVTVNVTEGDRYNVSEVRLAGDLIVSEEELRELLLVQSGATFSRREVVESSNRISDRLGDEGYAFANINPVPEIDEETKEVALTFYVDPGRRVYVRRINISGNARTRDEVLRRELRQLEGSWLSTARVQRSRERLDRLGFFEEVHIETPPVAGAPDLVDVNIDVTERPTGSIMAGVGYAETQGVIFNLGVAQENFMGTGKRVALNLERSEVSNVYDVSYTNPYHTMDGVSRGFRVFYRETDAEAALVSAYSTDAYGGGVNYGIPLTEFTTLRLGADYENTTIRTLQRTPEFIHDFIAENGDQFGAYKLTSGLTHDTRNRAIFPTRGALSSVSLETAAPGSDLQYYKARLRHQRYFPLRDQIALALNADLGYGSGYGGDSTLPPYEHFYAGGSHSVRGYRGNSLGPRDEWNNPIGGHARIVGNAELIFPPPFGENGRTVRMGLFLDAGNVYGRREVAENQWERERIDLGDLRYAAGVSLTWLSPVGVLRFSLARALNAEPDDRTETFQFTLGTGF
ncbi:outer membrane protein assembly factor BamA [Ectothiorhodospiraceae bacterium 2226]|nr:outer membrane protein assembly factor BamA [Ectothiorhodospiraceae bacterium 2226]